MKNLKTFVSVLAVAAAALFTLPASAQMANSEQDDDISKTTLVKVGDVAPTFKVTMLDGKIISTAALKGKVVLVNFWATWCPPCRAELQRVQKDIVDRFAGKNFVFLPISRGEKRDVVAAFIDKMNYKFAVGLDPDQSIFKLFASNYIPRNFLVGRDGKIAYISVGYDDKEFQEMLSTIEKSLK